MNKRSATLLLAIALLALQSTAGASLPADAWTIAMRPGISPGKPPAWASGTNGPPVADGTDGVLIPLPPTAPMEDDACLVVTVLFDDKGDGGPVVEWISPGGESVLLSAGLGETGVALGTNARTLLLPQTLTLDGGSLRLSYAGRMERLISATVRLAEARSVATLSSSAPCLVDGSLQALESRDVSGESFVPRWGDREQGGVVDAELSPANLRFDTQEPEFVVPVSRTPAGAVLSAQIAGLDPESRIEVSVNGTRFGILAPSSVALDDPSVTLSRSGRLVLAGWRRASLMLPASLWHQGENSISLKLLRAPGDPGNPVHGRDIRIGVLFAPEREKTAEDGTGERLSTGAQFVAPRPEAFRTGIPSVTGP